MIEKKFFKCYELNRMPNDPSVQVSDTMMLPQRMRAGSMNRIKQPPAGFITAAGVVNI